LHNEAVTTTNSPPEKSGRVDLTGWTSSVSFQVYLVANLRSVQNCPANWTSSTPPKYFSN